MNTKHAKLKAGLWLSTLVSVIGLLLIVFVAAFVEKILDPNYNKSLLTLISVIIAIIPPFLWLTVFYRQDRLNPEPKSYVLKTLILGALVQKAIYIPLMGFVFPNDSASVIAKGYIISIILAAIIQEAVKLISVRYSIYISTEFDEKVDGIIYGSALGLGFAAMTSIDRILQSGGAMLTNVTSLVVIETFAHASITGLSCYILSVSKQSKFNILRLPLALVIASSLNAITQFLLNAAVRNGFEVNYIVGLIPVALVAVLVFAVLVIISSKNEKEGTDVPKEATEPRKEFLAMLPVWGILVLVLVTGFFISHASQNMKAYTVESVVEVNYPSSWVQLKDEEYLFKAGNMIKTGGQEFISVKKIPLSSVMNVKTDSQEELLQSAAAAWSIKCGMNYRFYQSENGYVLSTKGKDSYAINYVYINNSKSASGSGSKPAIGYGRDVLSIFDDQLYITTISASYDDYVLNKDILNGASYNFIGN